MNRRRAALIGVILLSVLVRIILVWPRVGLPADDPDNYLPLAHSLAEGAGLEINGRPSAYRPPLYPLVLAAISPGSGDRFSVAIASLHVILGAMTTVFTAVAAYRWGLSPVRILVAAGLVALDPALVVQSRSVMTETLAACLLAGAVAMFAGDSWQSIVAGGFVLGLAALCRPSTLPIVGVAAFFVLVSSSGTWRTRFLKSVLLLVATSIPLIPWAIRNAVQLGEPVITTTHGGHTLALANNAIYYREVLDGAPDAVWSGPGQRVWFEKITRETEGMTEPQADRWLRQDTIRLIVARPRDFLRASLARLGRFWGVAPAAAVYPRSLRLLTAIWTIPFWVAAAWGLCRRDLWRWPRASALSVIIALTLVHAVFWTDLRMRAPVVPALALLAAIAGAPDSSKANLAKKI